MCCAQQRSGPLGRVVRVPPARQPRRSTLSLFWSWAGRGIGPRLFLLRGRVGRPCFRRRLACRGVSGGRPPSPLGFPCAPLPPRSGALSHTCAGGWGAPDRGAEDKVNNRAVSFATATASIVHVCGSLSHSAPRHGPVLTLVAARGASPGNHKRSALGFLLLNVPNLSPFYPRLSTASNLITTSPHFVNKISTGYPLI